MSHLKALRHGELTTLALSQKKRATLTFDLYPDITLAQACSLRANIKADLAVGFAPFYKVKG